MKCSEGYFSFAEFYFIEIRFELFLRIKKKEKIGKKRDSICSCVKKEKKGDRTVYLEVVVVAG